MIHRCAIIICNVYFLYRIARNSRDEVFVIFMDFANLRSVVRIDVNPSKFYLQNLFSS